MAGMNWKRVNQEDRVRRYDDSVLRESYRKSQLEAKKVRAEKAAEGRLRSARQHEEEQRLRAEQLRLKSEKKAELEEWLAKWSRQCKREHARILRDKRDGKTESSSAGRGLKGAHPARAGESPKERATRQAKQKPLAPQSKSPKSQTHKVTVARRGTGQRAPPTPSRPVARPEAAGPRFFVRPRASPAPERLVDPSAKPV